MKSNVYDEVIQFKCKNTLVIYVLLLLYKNVESKQPHKISTLQNMRFTTQELFMTRNKISSRIIGQFLRNHKFCTC